MRLCGIHFRAISDFHCKCPNWYSLYTDIMSLKIWLLTHWGRVTHICISKLTIIGSDNGLSPGRCQAIIWYNVGLLLIEPLGTNFSEISIGIQTFSFMKMHLNMSSAKWHPFCLGLNVVRLLLHLPGTNDLSLCRLMIFCLHNIHLRAAENHISCLLLFIFWKLELYLLYAAIYLFGTKITFQMPWLWVLKKAVTHCGQVMAYILQ